MWILTAAISGTPYTSMTQPLPVYPVVWATRCGTDIRRRCELVDGMSSPVAAIHGYNHPGN